MDIQSSCRWACTPYFSFDPLVASNEVHPIDVLPCFDQQEWATTVFRAIPKAVTTVFRAAKVESGVVVGPGKRIMESTTENVAVMAIISNKVEQSTSCSRQPVRFDSDMVSLVVADNRAAEPDRLRLDVCLAPLARLAPTTKIGDYAGKHVQVSVLRKQAHIISCQADIGADVLVIDRGLLAEKFPSVSIRRPTNTINRRAAPPPRWVKWTCS